MARWYVVQAENDLTEAGHMKSRKILFEKRLPYYAKACRHYLKAYEIDASVFTLMRIEEAMDCCWKANMYDEEEQFKAFEVIYSQEHPQETEHGDSGVALMDMGG